MRRGYAPILEVGRCGLTRGDRFTRSRNHARFSKVRFAVHDHRRVHRPRVVGDPNRSVDSGLAGYPVERTQMDAIEILRELREAIRAEVRASAYDGYDGYTAMVRLLGILDRFDELNEKK